MRWSNGFAKKYLFYAVRTPNWWQPTLEWLTQLPWSTHDNLRVEKRYAYGTPTVSIGFCTCHMLKGTFPWCTYRLSEWYFASPALQGGWASQLHTDEEPRAPPVINFSFPPSPAGKNEVHLRWICQSSAKENYCAGLLGDGWCGLTLGPKICLAGNVATHTPHQGVCRGGWPKQG